MQLRHILFAAALSLGCLSLEAQAQARYVFYFIGDGMGVNQVNATETYLGALEGRIGTSPLTFTSFPNVALVTTQSGTNGVTDSAAGGTALATGEKSKNGALGLKSDAATPVKSIAAAAQKAGAAVGVTTSVTVDHATPAAFYAHVPSRKDTKTIGKQLVASGYDFFAGSDFGGSTAENEDMYALAKKNGYVICRGAKDYSPKATKGKKVILLQSEDDSKRNRASLPYAIDRATMSSSLTLADITRLGISHLSTIDASQKKGFFMMVEGGEIDWACHSNDAATMIHETMDMDQALANAMKFYNAHPDETLIVVTADHETGGLVLGTGAYTLHLDRLQHQKMSADAYSKHLMQLHSKLSASEFTWERAKQDLQENWGFYAALKLSDSQDARLRAAFDALAAGSTEGGAKSLYSQTDALAETARAIMAEQAHVGWVSGGHSNGYVPCFALGKGAELFNGRIDNTEVPKRIAKAAGWTLEN